MDSKGQTALEYLLILVIALAVIVAIMVWMQATGSEIGGQTGERVDDIACALKDCTADAQCDNVPPCRDGSTCNPGTHKCQKP